jgi:formylglycine-generating enzyme required for sulfatase activity
MRSSRSSRWLDTPIDGLVPLWREMPAGHFWMGSPEGEGDPNEHPRHEVAIERPFCCAAGPVTQRQYAAFDDQRKPSQPHHPVVGVTWYEAVSFCRWLSGAFPWARGARLPTEPEWEYLCRAGTTTRYWSGDKDEDLARVGWYVANSNHRIHRVGEKPANPWGVYDVHGNVWEWTLDLSKSYEDRKAGFYLDPTAVDLDTAARQDAGGGGGRVFRGGGYFYVAGRARAAYRNWVDPGDEVWNQGFRIALPVVPELLILHITPRPGAGHLL